MPIKAFSTKPALGTWQKRMFKVASVAPMSSIPICDDNSHKSRVFNAMSASPAVDQGKFHFFEVISELDCGITMENLIDSDYSG
mgnify:CR=1 FL=1